MKRLLLITVLLAMLFSAAGCAVLVSRTASGVANRSYIGMSVAEFKKLTGGHFGVETMTAEHTVYRINEWSGPTGNRYISGAMLFHFDSRGRLFKIDSRDFVPHFFPGLP
jgi:opacity protein-like surface antigen